VRKTISIDFETRSASDIKLGVERYSKDPECDVLTLSFRLSDQDRVARWNHGFDLQQSPTEQMLRDLTALHRHVREGGLIRGFNVMFEWHIWNNVCVPKYGWPELPLEQCIDTMAQAAAQNLPQALGKCAEAMQLPTRKDTRGKYLISRLCVPHKETKTRKGKWVEDETLFAELCDYCDQDVVVEENIARRLRQLTPYEQEVWVMTQRVNLRGVPIAVEEISNVVSIIDAEKERLNRELRQITGRAVTSATKREDLLAWCNARAADVYFEDDVESDDEPAVLLANMRGATVDDVLKRDDLPADVRRVLEIRRAVCQTSTAKYAKMLKVMAADRSIKNMYVYHGAGTGRWVSRGGVNVQNFRRPVLGDLDIETAHEVLGRGSHFDAYMLFGDAIMDAAVSCLRGVIKAPDGHDFIDADFSSVENRAGVWLADQSDKLELFAKGLDEYKVFASLFFNVEYDAVDKGMRQFSKSAVLGGMFGQGPAGLVLYAAGLGVTLTLERAQELIKNYRTQYHKVRNLWYRCGDASIEAVRTPGVWVDAGTKLQLLCHRDFLWMKLPSGRLISWARPRVERRLVPWTEQEVIGYDVLDNPIIVEKPVYRDVVTVESIDTKTRIYKRHPLIGSSIYQSGVQGTARDFLVNGMVNVEREGYPVVMTTHDELMSLVREGFGSEQEFGELMCTKAEWFKEVPLAFEAWRGKRFRK
jgi:DNA polymerase bacteriophage-type